MIITEQRLGNAKISCQQCIYIRPLIIREVGLDTCWLVTKQLIHLLHDLWCNLVDKLQGGQVVIDLQSKKKSKALLKPQTLKVSCLACHFT